ncbi:MAG: aminotransferase class III-fold pyridoxal phosphate-dependent enzyme [Gammaproteobacteria bacterium]|nr:aminotransferase class III-fold pyridoxal phosphate-dependent enzyme [Gammaproteobacteria bacterium]
MTKARGASSRARSWTGSRGLPKVSHGTGIYVYDTSGKRYLDASGGPAVYCLGHGHPEVTAAIVRQLERIAHGYRYTFTSDPLEQLREIVTRACAGPDGARSTGDPARRLDSMVFVCDGSEAVESALKVALQYHSARGEMTRRRFIARRRSWHGNTLGALGVSDFLDRRAPFEGALVDASFLPQVSMYRPPAGVAPGSLGAHAAAELEAEILRVGPERVAAFIFEPVVGAAGGALPPPPGYAQRVREICSRHGVLLIADEVMCGSGRTGTWRALEQDGVVPDIMAVAKGLAGGYQPLGATIYSHAIAEVLEAADGGPLTGHTFSGHTAACAAGVAVQTIVARDRLLERVASAGARFQTALREALGRYEAVGDVRGRGFLIGIELVADRATRAPFPPERALAETIGSCAFEDGLICYAAGGNLDGVAGDIILLAPPYIATDAELEEIIARFARAVERGLGKRAGG